MRRTTIGLLATVALALVGGSALAEEEPGIDDPGMPVPVLEPIVRSEATMRCDGGPCEGTEGRDVVWGSTASDEIHAKGARDGVAARSGHDFLFGGTHADVLFGGPGDDSLQGGGGADDLDDSEGGDRDGIRGGPGEDFAMLLDGDGDDAVSCGEGATDRAWVDLGDEIDHRSCEEVTIPVRAIGVLEVPEITFYMYGDYALTDERSGRHLALQADRDDPPAEDLSGLVGERIVVYGTAVPGMEAGQVEGGPPLVEVTDAYRAR